jgi:aspartyl-tRNA synthetase
VAFPAGPEHGAIVSITPFGAMRTHGAGTLTTADVGDEVVLAGWVWSRRDHGGVMFVDLRDRSGVVQVVADPALSDGIVEVAQRLRDEWVVRIIGVVRARPEGMRNTRIATGDVEVAITALEVLSESRTPPFPVDDATNVGEDLRLLHRYVDLRRPRMAANLALRARALSVIRRVMERHGFLEIETPQLTRPTPEGARDFLVPSRIRPRETYALPQSPQLFKQLLMVGGVERYYQIARCFRDEDMRADRQPEFTQLDVELSFGDEEDVYALMEELYGELWSDVLGVELTVPFPRLTFAEALRRFGSDKPDLRYGMELIDLSATLSGTGVGVFRGVLDEGGSVIALCVPAGEPLTRRELDGWVEWAKQRGAGGLAWGFVEAGEDGGVTLRSPLAKFLSEAEIAAIITSCAASVGDTVLFLAGPTRATQVLGGALRVALAAQRGLVPEGQWAFVWITEPPMFDASTDRSGRPDGGWVPNHHPFTAPATQWIDTFETDPAGATARAYDIVLNGVELASGSIRIHDAELQRRVLRFLGISDEAAEAKFGFLLRGLAHGVPPHGGIAPGIDRTIMLMAGEDSIREVIAFPKTQSGTCLLTDAPAAYDEGALADVGLRLAPSPAKGA